MSKKLLVIASLITLGMASYARQSLADSPFLKQGMQEYNEGNYADAAGHLGAALSSDFNNAVLHYFLGSCYVHMKQKEAAIREFRIAYALDPDKEVGRFAKQALVGYGVDVPAESKDKPKDPAKLATGTNSTPAGPSSSTANTPISTQSESLKNAAKVELPKAVVKGLPMIFPKTEIQKTAANLLDLMSQEAKPGSMRLSPNGTNLYIRNYEMTPAPATTTTPKKSWDQFTP